MMIIYDVVGETYPVSPFLNSTGISLGIFGIISKLILRSTGISVCFYLCLFYLCLFYFILFISDYPFSISTSRSYLLSPI